MAKKEEKKATASVNPDLMDALNNMFSKIITKEVGEIIDDKKKKYKKSPPPQPDDTTKIIGITTAMNASIVAGVNLIPGPTGLIAAIPTFLLLERNNINMFCDIAAAHDRLHDVKLEEILAPYLEDNTLEQGKQAVGKIILPAMTQNASISIIKKIAANMGLKLTKRAIVGFVPVAGAVLLGGWTTYTTIRLGQSARNLFSQEVEFVELNEFELEQYLAVGDPTLTWSPKIMEAHILLLANMMKCDQDVNFKELTYLYDVLNQLQLTAEQQAMLSEKISSPEQTEIDLSLFMEYPQELEPLFLNLSTMAKKDGVVKPQELEYLIKIADKLGYPQTKLREFIYN